VPAGGVLQFAGSVPPQQKTAFPTVLQTVAQSAVTWGGLRTLLQPAGTALLSTAARQYWLGLPSQETAALWSNHVLK
jgi:hypothetical protein